MITLNRTIIAAIVALFFQSLKLNAQVWSNSAKPTFGGVLAAEVPVYRSKKDSADLVLIDVQLKDLFDRKPYNKKKVDSLSVIKSNLYQNGITGFAIHYYPTPGYLPFDSIKYIQEKSSIRKVSISSKNMKKIPIEILQCINLQSLQIVNSSLRRIQGELNDLKSLKRVAILNNRSTRHLKLNKNVNVTELIMRGENPQSLPRSFKKFESLTKLDLSQNGLKKFHNGARHNKKLEELELQRNQISLKENNIKAHPYLQRLGLQYNQVETVPSSIGKLENLMKASFNHNKVETVSDKIGRLQKLENLSFYNNKLTAVPAGVYEIKSLKVIDLFHNRIYKLEENLITNWSQLQTLYISHNYLTAIPESVNKLNSLTEIYAYDNLMKELPSSICDLSGLKVLRVNINQLTALPACFDKLGNLEELDLSENKITKLPESVFGFEKMKIFAIVNNPWTPEMEKSLPLLTKRMKDNDVHVHLNSYGDESDQH